MSENVDRTVPLPAGDHDHEACHGDGKPERHPELPQARLYSPEQMAVSYHQPLNDPVWIDTYDHLRDDDPVLGLYLNRQARALPWWIMKNHHAANLLFGDLPVLVTLCEMCSGSSAFRTLIDGRRLMFRPRGHFNGTNLMEEISSKTLMSPFTGVALTGPLRGKALPRLPLLQCLWREWRAMHPTTQVVYGEQAEREGHGSGSSPGSAGVPPSFLESLVRPRDLRLKHNVLVLGVEAGAQARAYPLEILAGIGPVLNDVLGGLEIAVRCQPGTLQALAFRRRVGDRVLVFDGSGTGEVRDRETGSLWSEMGEAVSGPLAGTQLVYVNSGVEEFYSFAAYHP
ncbi:MAG: DUF3179 domain-containing (seleno)protein, partial [Stellaceae bacterium]